MSTFGPGKLPEVEESLGHSSLGLKKALEGDPPRPKPEIDGSK